MDKAKKKKVLKTLFIISLVPKVFTFKALATYYITNHIDKEVSFSDQLVEPSCTLDDNEFKYVSGYLYKNNKVYPIYSDLES